MSRAVKVPSLGSKSATHRPEGEFPERKTGGARKASLAPDMVQVRQEGWSKFSFSIFTVVVGEAPPSSTPFSVALAHPGLHSLGLVLVIFFRKRDAPRNIREHTNVPRDWGNLVGLPQLEQP